MIFYHDTVLQSSCVNNPLPKSISGLIDGQDFGGPIPQLSECKWCDKKMPFWAIFTQWHLQNLTINNLKPELLACSQHIMTTSILLFESVKIN